MARIDLAAVVEEWIVMYRTWSDDRLAAEWALARKEWAKRFFPGDRVWNQQRMWPDTEDVVNALRDRTALGATAALGDGVKEITGRFQRGELRPTESDLGLHAGTWAVNAVLAERIGRAPPDG